MNINDDEYKWLVNLVQDRNQHLNLSFEQAAKLNQYEETDFEFTNVWDEIERDKKHMKSILNKEPQGWRIEIVKEEEEAEFDRKFAFSMSKQKNGA